MYERLYRDVIFPFYDTVVRRRRTWPTYRRLAANARMDPAELDRLRRRKLAETVRYAAAHSPFHRDLLAARGVDPADVRDVAVLREAGFMTDKDSVRRAGDAILSTAYAGRRTFRKHTSGTTGVPLAIHISPGQEAIRAATKLRSEDWIGKPIGTPTTIVWSHRLDRSPLAALKENLWWRFQNYRFLSAFRVDEESLAGYVARIRRNRTRFLETFVNVVYLMGKAILARGLEPPRLDGIVIGAERLMDHQRELVEEAFRCPVYNRYGSSEFSNIACECTRREGLHINADNLWVEVVNEAGEPVAGEEGELVITDLNNRLMPFIRYRIGDRGVMGERPCSCGRVFPVLDAVTGRTFEILRTPAGREFHGMYFHWRLKYVTGLFRFQVIQRALDRIDVKAIGDGTVPEEIVGQGIEAALAELSEEGVAVAVSFVDDIPLTPAGKMAFFISEIDGGAGGGASGGDPRGGDNPGAGAGNERTTK
ncbi:MAG: phenylacetate--CoA ligase family protein [Candidatus Krumholzibacteriota bacterium]|nr:phenylacetate--CoA ligase family protein [Candidatus Krumholzibacteriota bacterium]